MYKYPSIDQFRNMVKSLTLTNQYVGIDECGVAIYDKSKVLPTLTINGTVKLHGTNASFVLDVDNNYYMQSRERVLSIESDNANFCVYGHRVKDHVKPKLQGILNNHPNAKAVVLYGEWCGKGIQKGVGVSELDKMFVSFGIKIIDNDGNGIWLSADNLSYFKSDDLRLFNIYDFPTYSLELDLNNPQMIQNKLIEITNDVERECPVAKHFGISGIGEGVVWSTYNKGSRHTMKVKGEKHSVTKVKKLAEVDVEHLENVTKFIEYAVTENRLNQGLTYLDENNIDIDIKNLGSFIKWVVGDIIKEEFDVMIANNISSKDVGSKTSVVARRFFMDRL